LAAAGVADAAEAFEAGACGVRLDLAGAAGSVAAGLGLAWMRMAGS
jgi:hypothetical protein